MPNENSDELMKQREAQYSSIESNLYQDIGFFMLNFAVAEMAITSLVGILMGATDLKVVDALLDKATAGFKAEKLQKLAKLHGGLGPMLKSDFSKFENKAIPLRNILVHSLISVGPESAYPVYNASSIGNLPWVAFDMEFHGPTGVPKAIEALELFTCGVWLQKFALKISAAGTSFNSGGILEYRAERNAGDGKL
jgi:hypothetical protein